MANPGQFAPNDDSHDPSLAPGFRLSHYEITGEGGLGVVYKAIDVKLDRPVALKVISRESIDFIAMECVDGKGLNVLLAEHAAGTPFPLPLRLHYMRQAASALTTAHPSPASSIAT